MKDKTDNRPAITRIAEMLDCPPGKAPERVAELLEGFPVDMLPGSVDDITIQWNDEIRSGYYNPYLREWWIYTLIGAHCVESKDITRWWPLPATVEETK